MASKIREEGKAASDGTKSADNNADKDLTNNGNNISEERAHNGEDDANKVTDEAKQLVKQAEDESNVGGNEHLDNGKNASDDRSNEAEESAQQSDNISDQETYEDSSISFDISDGLSEDGDDVLEVGGQNHGDRGVNIQSHNSLDLDLNLGNDTLEVVARNTSAFELSVTC